MNSLIVLFVLGLGAFTHSTPVHDQHAVTVDHAFLEKQYKILGLFEHVHQPTMMEELLKICENVHDPAKWLMENKESFEKPDVVETMMEFFHNNYMVPKGVPFSEYTRQHLEQAIALFKLFYYAKDFETFYNTAVVMKKFVNEPMFVYSLSVAVVHRKDTYGIVLPPIYETYPWFFFSSEAIQDAYKHKMQHKAPMKKGSEHVHYVYANYSGHYLNLHWEQSLSYLTEDVGVNAYWYYFHLHYPFWMDGEEFQLKNDFRGELFLVMLHGIVARYHLERLSHGEGQIPIFDWNVPFETPYQPSLQYPNGLMFPERPSFAKMENSYFTYGEHINSMYGYSYTHVNNFERRIHDAIDAGLLFNSKTGKMEMLYDPKHHEIAVNNFGNLIQCNSDSPNPKYYREYMTFASHLLGYSYTHKDWKHIVPSALEHHETALRDPAFYQLGKRIIEMYHYFQTVHMQPYRKDELVFPGVTIKNVEMDKLITYFEYFLSDIHNVVMYDEEELKDNSFKVYAAQKRLTHKPFTYKIHVSSDKETDAMVKVFLGPKYDEYERYMNISENRWNFLPIDNFKWHLTSGDNIIKRSSQESDYFADDETTHQQFLKKVKDSYKDQKPFVIENKDNYFRFPHRMMLPIGSYNGIPYQFYFMVCPYKPFSGKEAEMSFNYPRPGTGGGYLDDYPLYYPFDKPIKFGKMFVTEVPNSYFYEVKITHKSLGDDKLPMAEHTL